ncbi:unc-22 [Symbiodinium microadriaticum]|nr:unc-22 [Symbiodinium microadriaticum]
MAFSKSARFFGRDSRSTPGPGTYNPQASLALPRVLVHSFGRPTSRRPKLQKQEHQLPIVEVHMLDLTKDLGHGGLGSVHQGNLQGKAVAVKRYRHQPGMLSNPDDDRRALRTEALLLHGIRHPNIVSVQGLLSENGTVNGYVMEKLGVSLHKASKKGHWCRDRIAKAFRPTCEAVCHIHTLLIAHTDIKAANICFKHPFSCSVKLIDFDAAVELTHPSQVMTRLSGNLTAKSPEGDSNQPTRYLPEDTFMVGVTFYTLLGETADDPAALELRARASPLLRPEAQRPSMLQIVQRWNNNIEDDPKAAEPLPVLLGGSPDIFSKLCA